MTVNVKVTGLGQVVEELKRQNDRVNNETKEVLKEMSKKIKKDAKAKAPILTGKTKQSIIIQSSKKGLMKKILPKKNSENGYVAHFHEYGTSKMSARPFMAPAEQKNKDEYNKKMEAIVKKKVII